MDIDRPMLAPATDGTRAVRTAAAMYVVLGLGFGSGTAVTLWHFDRHGELPMTPFGFRSLAGGPFEELDPAKFGALGWSLVAVSALDVLTGIWLWRGRRSGLRLGLVSALPSLGLGVGFALPILLVGVPVRMALAIIGRRALR